MSSSICESILRAQQPTLDAASSNLICAAYADVHDASEKTNFGGQQLAPLPAGKTFIQDSSGFAAVSLVDPPTPEGYEFIFGPIAAANNAPGVIIHPIISGDMCSSLD